MQKHIIGIAAAGAMAAALGITLGGYGALHQSPPAVTMPSLPAQLDSRVELRPGEKLRTVDYVPHTNIPVDAHVQYSDGDTGTIKFRTQGTPGATNDLTRFYATDKDQPVQRIQRQREMAADGVTPQRDRIYWPNGKLKQVGDLVSADKFESFAYQLDGQSVVRHTVLTRHDRYPTYGWRIDEKELYRTDRSLEEKIARIADDGLETDFFWESGTLKQRISTDQYESKQKTESFQPDGKTPTVVIDQTYETVIQDLENGKPKETLQFGYQCGSFKRTVFNANGVRTFQQEALLKVPTTPEIQACHVDASMYRVTQVDWYDEVGVLRKELSINDKGLLYSQAERTPGVLTKKADDYSFAPGTRIFYNLENRVSRTVIIDADGKIAEAHDYKDGEGEVGPTPDPKLLEIAPFAPPPPSLKNAHLPYRGY